MKKCPKCAELNGDGREDCWSCHAPFVTNTQEHKKKICPKCGSVYMTAKMVCDECGTYLTDFDNTSMTAAGSAHINDDRAGCFLIGLAVLIPLLGFILGYIWISNGKTESGKSLILAGIISCVISLFLSVMLKGCS